MDDETPGLAAPYLPPKARRLFGVLHKRSLRPTPLGTWSWTRFFFDLQPPLDGQQLWRLAYFSAHDGVKPVRVLRLSSWCSVRKAEDEGRPYLLVVGVGEADADWPLGTEELVLQCASEEERDRWHAGLGASVAAGVACSSLGRRLSRSAARQQRGRGERRVEHPHAEHPFFFHAKAIKVKAKRMVFLDLVEFARGWRRLSPRALHDCICIFQGPPFHLPAPLGDAQRGRGGDAPRACAWRVAPTAAEGVDMRLAAESAVRRARRSGAHAQWPARTPASLEEIAWTAHLDPASGRMYYFNTLTRETTWDPPGPSLDEDEDEDEEARRKRSRSHSRSHSPKLTREDPEGEKEVARESARFLAVLRFKQRFGCLHWLWVWSSSSTAGSGSRGVICKQHLVAARLHQHHFGFPQHSIVPRERLPGSSPVPSSATDGKKADVATADTDDTASDAPLNENEAQCELRAMSRFLVSLHYRPLQLDPEYWDNDVSGDADASGGTPRAGVAEQCRTGHLLGTWSAAARSLAELIMDSNPHELIPLLAVPVPSSAGPQVGASSVGTSSAEQSHQRFAEVLGRSVRDRLQHRRAGKRLRAKLDTPDIRAMLRAVLAANKSAVGGPNRSESSSRARAGAGAQPHGLSWLQMFCPTCICRDSAFPARAEDGDDDEEGGAHNHHAAALLRSAEERTKKGGDEEVTRTQLMMHQVIVSGVVTTSAADRRRER